MRNSNMSERELHGVVKLNLYLGNLLSFGMLLSSILRILMMDHIRLHYRSSAKGRAPRIGPASLDILIGEWNGGAIFVCLAPVILRIGLRTHFFLIKKSVSKSDSSCLYYITLLSIHKIVFRIFRDELLFQVLLFQFIITLVNGHRDAIGTSILRVRKL